MRSTRRIGAACDAAQNSGAPPAGSAIFKFDSDRQKLLSAVQLLPSHWL